ncbi:hypothetical protein QTO34_018409 [Cnephaeus nilssonii]|uniref:Uncharacterized protein n=1 Tax=Cnephaeus nilssonii TaxID=3371016 RepID=A0AA40HYS8_CNENI|nr:hypothetical protein QTO34_018409 [Eptesicus nilssonii]
MQRQRNRSQMKEMEKSKLLDIEFKTMVIRLLKNLLETSKKFSETLKDMKKDQLEIKHTLTEIRNNIQRSSSRLEDPKNQVKDVKYEEAKNTQLEKQKEKRIQKYEDSVRSLWDNFKRTNIRIMGVPEEEREQDTGNLFEEIKTENFPHLSRTPRGCQRAGFSLVLQATPLGKAPDTGLMAVSQIVNAKEKFLKGTKSATLVHT